jgi:hypothetical protein
MATKQILDFYAQQSIMTTPGTYKSSMTELPDEVSSLARIVQGLGIYDEVAKEFYGFTVPKEREQEIHIRRMTQMLRTILSLDNRPLTVGRPPEKRLVSRCNHFVLLLLAMLRAKHIPARARCGFGAYFNPGHFEDHWVVEYWDAAKDRWTLVDPQFDETWRTQLHIKHNVLDVPRDQFLVAADAWRRYRSGTADPAMFGISFAKLHGSWYIAGNLMRDLAALNKVEVLPWDVWGVQPQKDEKLTPVQTKLFDTIADLTADPDRTFAGFRETYEQRDDLRVPPTIFNALRERMEEL